MRYRDYAAVANHPRRIAKLTSDLQVVAVRIDDRNTEEVPVEDGPSGQLRLLATPTMIDGFAAGDLVRFDDGTLDLSEHGGNLGLLFEFSQPLGDLPQLLAESLDRVTGWVDGWHGDHRGSVLTGTVPVSSGWKPIEECCREFASSHEGSWFYKNVYDEADRPLNWWL